MSYQLLPFEFSHFDENFLLVNECGDYSFITSDEFNLLVHDEIEKLSTQKIHELESKHFIAHRENINTAITLSAAKYRSRKAFLRDFTSLHMLVITLKCNHRCEYCQVSSEEEDAHKFDMSPDVARKAVEYIFKSPSNDIKIEFQGGEPLLNWPALEAAVLQAEKINSTANKKLSFVICSNIFALNENHLRFFKEHNIYISTSLDGPKKLHDMHRKMRTSASSHDQFVKKLSQAREFLGHDKVAALMTTTNDSLSIVEDIIDEYVNLKFDGIFFRPLNPYGDAYKNKLYYSPDHFFKMYQKGLEYIIEINKKGVYFCEYYTELLMKRILTPFSTGFVDLQSPSGAGISGVIYDYNGDVYPADEGRMLARMGNTYFKMGNIFQNTYQEIFHGNLIRNIIHSSCIEYIPGCSECSFRTYCGVDVFRNYLETGNISRSRPDSFFCQKQKKIFNYLFHKLDDPVFMKIIHSWIAPKS